MVHTPPHGPLSRGYAKRKPVLVILTNPSRSILRKNLDRASEQIRSLIQLTTNMAILLHYEEVRLTFTLFF